MTRREHAERIVAICRRSIAARDQAIEEVERELQRFAEECWQTQDESLHSREWLDDADAPAGYTDAL